MASDKITDGPGHDLPSANHEKPPASLSRRDFLNREDRG